MEFFYNFQICYTKCFIQLSAFMLLYLYAKLFPQNPSTRFFPKKIIWANFKPLCNCNFRSLLAQKLQNRVFRNKSEIFDHVTCDYTWKSSFWTHFELLLAPKLLNNVIPKKITCDNFKSSCCFNVIQKIRKVPCTEFW